MTELINEQISLVTVTEFRGNFPEIPLANHINLSELTEGDENPFFATLRIGKKDVSSGNGNFYDGDNIRDIASQIVTLDSNMGHVPDDKSDSAFPMPAGHWVGTLMEGSELWGKLYVPKTRPDVREFLRIKKAQNGKVSTSIYGKANREYDAKLGAYRVKNLTLETVDLAPILRSGVQDLATVPHITKEMSDSDEDESTMTEQIKDKYTIIAEMTIKDAPYVPEAVQEQIISVSTERRLVTEMTAVLGVQGDKMLDRLSELLAIEKKHGEIVTEQINRRIEDEVARLVMPDVAKVTEGVKGVREMVVNLVKAQNLPNVDAVKAAVMKAAEVPMVQTMAKLAVSEMGKHTSGGYRDSNQSEGDRVALWSKYMDVPPPETGGQS